MVKRGIITLYNLQNTEKDININNINNKNRNDISDKKYMDYLEKIGSNQKIKLICIIDENKYYKYNDVIIYPHIYQLHFEFNFYFNENIENYPLTQLLIEFIHGYIIKIKNLMNIKIISFYF